jgi:hypothetical protein
MPLYNPPLLVQDEGTTQGSVDTINFTGSAVTASVSGSTATINIVGGSGSFSMTQVEIDFGSTPTSYKTFVISDASITSSSKILVMQAGDAPTGKSADENEMDYLKFSAIPGSGQFTLNAYSIDGSVINKFKINYTIA